MNIYSQAKQLDAFVDDAMTMNKYAADFKNLVTRRNVE